MEANGGGLLQAFVIAPPLAGRAGAQRPPATMGACGGLAFAAGLDSSEDENVRKAGRIVGAFAGVTFLHGMVGFLGGRER